MTGLHADLVDALGAAYPSVSEEAVASRVERVLAAARTDGTFDERRLDAAVRGWIIRFTHRSAAPASLAHAVSDLRVFLGLEKVARKSMLAGLLDRAPVLFAVLGVVASAVFGLSYIHFYSSLGITPDEAGIGTSQILARSVLGTLAVAFAIAVVFYAAVVPFVPIVPRGKRSATVVSPSRDEVQGFYAILVVCLLFAAVVAPTGGGHRVLQAFIAVVVATAVVAALVSATCTTYRGRFVPTRFAFRRPAVHFESRAYLSSFVAAALASLLSAIVGILAFSTSLTARAENGGAVRASTFLGMSFLSLSAQPANVVWSASSPAGIKLPACMLYLGQDANLVSIYNPVLGETLRVPESNVVVRTKQDRSSCYAPANYLLPTIKQEGATLFRCNHGKWHDSAGISYTYSWLVEGRLISPRAPKGEVELNGFPRGASLICRVEARNPQGHDTAYSNLFIVPDDT